MRDVLRDRRHCKRSSLRQWVSVALSVVLLAAGVGGCASSMMILTQPSNAIVLVDGREIGRSPILYPGQSAWDGAIEVRARLEGYQEAVRQVPREPNWYHIGESVLFPPAVAWGWYLPRSVALFLEPTSTTPK